MNAKGWDSYAQLALAELDTRVAAYFGKAARHPKIEFVAVIDERRKLQDDGSVLVKATLGKCLPERNLIQLVNGPEWPRVAVHELVHLYNLHRKEATIDRLTNEVVRHLKSPQLWGEHASVS